MKIQAIGDARGHVSGYGKRLLKNLHQANGLIAREIPQQMSRYINERRTPDLTGQKKNKPSYAAQKREAIGHDIPLKYTGKLSNASRAQVKSLGNGEYLVQPPRDRVKIMSYLRARGYDMWRWGKPLQNFAVRRWTEALQRSRG